MQRRPLRLVEAMVRRKPQMKRVVALLPAASRDPFSGPPDARNDEEEQVDSLIRDLAQRFDFSLLMSGDRRYTRQLADEFARTLTKEALAAGMKREVVQERVTNLLPWLLRGFRAFNDRLRTAFKIVRERPV